VEEVKETELATAPAGLRANFAAFLDSTGDERSNLGFHIGLLRATGTIDAVEWMADRGWAAWLIEALRDAGRDYIRTHRDVAKARLELGHELGDHPTRSARMVFVRTTQKTYSRGKRRTKNKWPAPSRGREAVLLGQDT